MHRKDATLIPQPERRVAGSKIRRICAAILINLLVVGTVPAQTPGHGCRNIDNIELCVVSVLHLISKPNFYDGKIVLVSGYYRTDWELSAVFTSRDWAGLNDGAYGIWVRIGSAAKEGAAEDGLTRFYAIMEKARDIKFVDASVANNNYVKVGGRFETGNRGHLGLYNGQIHGITRFIVQKEY